MTYNSLLNLVLSAAIVFGAVACKTTSPEKPSDDQAAASEAAKTTEGDSDGSPAREGLDEGSGEADELPDEDGGDDGEENALDQEEPESSEGSATVVGSLDKDTIREVIDEHRNEIRFCYEKQLLKTPELAGQVTMKFTIAVTGKVISAEVETTTLENSAVENCMASAIKRWVFPQPKGGGIVIVKYPFDFTADK